MPQTPAADSGAVVIPVTITPLIPSSYLRGPLVARAFNTGADKAIVEVAFSFTGVGSATGTAVGAKDSTGTNMAALNLDASGFLKVNVAAGGAGGGAVTQASSSTVPWLVAPSTGATFTVLQGSSSTLPWMVAASTSTTIYSPFTADSNSIAQAYAQGVTSTSKLGTIVMGNVTTSAPTYVTAQSSPLSLDTAGALRVNVTAGGGTGGTSSNFGSVFPTSGTAIGFKDSTGTNMAAGNLDASGFLKVNVAAGGAGGGAVTQASSSTVPWEDDIRSLNGTTILTGTGASGAGAQRVVLTNDGLSTATVLQGSSSTLPWRFVGAPGFQAIVDSASTSTQALGLSGSGLSYYLTGVIFSASAVMTIKVTSSTTAGNQCATSPTVVVPGMFLPASGGAPLTFPQPIKVTANSALCCVIPSASASCILTGYIAP